MIEIDMDVPPMCCDCPMFEKPATKNILFFEGIVTNGKCRALPIKDYEGRVVSYQRVSTSEEIKHRTRSKFCPLKECKK